MKLVVVESPSKAKTIEKYLGKDFQVRASYGHICDLPSKSGSVLPEQDFAMIYQMPEKSVRYFQKLASAAKEAKEIYLATDPDREGEAISWHVMRTLKEQKVISDAIPVRRVVFHEITKKAVQEAIRNPRDIDVNLVDAQQARRALDYLVGFTLSPVLWRKLPGAKSAGRVQSVALRLICERMQEIESFKSSEFWTLNAEFLTKAQVPFPAKLHTLNGQRLEKFSIINQSHAQQVKEQLLAESFYVHLIEPKSTKRNPHPPFTTSTLQQEASRKLGFSAKKTMQLAQQLYEGVSIDGETVGLITYMRTDSVALAKEAVDTISAYIKNEIGPEYLPASPWTYKSKAKNAQEAHEAIRPTSVDRTPYKLQDCLEVDMFALYDLIWKRTVACQMSSVEFNTLTITISSRSSVSSFRAHGSVIKFDGFYKIYQEDLDDPQDEQESKLLPSMEEGDGLAMKDLEAAQHFTQPPPKYTEASLVKKLEELGIGRPSTYASILSVIQERDYVKFEKKRFVPQPRGRIVTAFLSKFFAQYVEYNFTASLEDELDEVSLGKLNWKMLLRKFWDGFILNVNEVSDIPTKEILATVEECLAQHLFGDDPDARRCKTCQIGTLELRLGKYGAFISCNRYPDCSYKRNVEEGAGGDDQTESAAIQQDGLLGYVDNESIWLRKGPYGYYIQMGQHNKDDTIKPKRVPLPSIYQPDQITLELAANLLTLPKKLGVDVDTGQEVLVGIGKFGPYIKRGNKFTSIPKDVDPFKVDIAGAIQIVSNRGAKN